MSTVRQSLTQRRVVLALALLAGAIAACDGSATAPAEMRRVPTQPAATEGDTTQCRRGWVIIAGVYVCNEDS
jgi:hypothetical protein